MAISGVNVPFRKHFFLSVQPKILFLEFPDKSLSSDESLLIEKWRAALLSRNKVWSAAVVRTFINVL